jgi:ribosomal protein S18 acetylase RimI-like enzyme
MPAVRGDVQVRTLAPDEAHVVAALVRTVVGPLAYYSEAARAAEIAKYSAADLAGMAEGDAAGVIVAATGATIVGFCISRYDDGVIWLSWFGVDPEWRGSGVGTALLGALEAGVRARGCHKIWCDTRTENVRSQAVLRRAGYTEICRLDDHWYGQDFVLWQKVVRGGAEPTAEPTSGGSRASAR